MEQLKDKLNELKEKILQIEKKLQIEEKKGELSELESLSSQPNFWRDEIAAQKVMRQIATIKEDIQTIDHFNEKLKDGYTYLDFLSSALGDERQSLIVEAEKEIKDLEKKLSDFETKLFLSGEYDENDAIISIHAGQGGTEAMDWVAMLYRMYSRFVESKGWSLEMIDENVGEEAGFKTVAFLVRGPKGYGFLKGEAGVHRLVRLSPFNAQNLRQTSFALVEVMPAVEEEEKVDIKEEDLEWEFFRSGGHGGQNVNKVSTAVRVRHKPTGLTVTSQAQRYQAQNRKLALLLLQSKLNQIEEERQRGEKEALKGGHKIAGWGNQIRSYVLHPYHQVKDLRTGYETSDTEGVLDGKLDPFIEEQVRKLYML